MKVLTIKELRTQLDLMEKAWSEEETSICGRFEDQQIYMDYFTKSGNIGKYEGLGLGVDLIFTHEFGLVLVQPKT